MDIKYMRMAIEQAELGITKGHGGPFGAVIVKNDNVIGRGHNKVLKHNSPILHGEMVAISCATKKLKNCDLSGCDIYTTGEPCPMCLTALLWVNVDNIYYGCTIADNESIGFRDDKFNSVMNIDRTKIPSLKQLGREECLEIFERYRNIKSKKNY